MRYIFAGTTAVVYGFLSVPADFQGDTLLIQTKIVHIIDLFIK